MFDGDSSHDTMPAKNIHKHNEAGIDAYPGHHEDCISIFEELKRIHGWLFVC